MLFVVLLSVLYSFANVWILSEKIKKKHSRFRFVFYPFVPFVYKTTITESLHLRITVVEACLCMCFACGVSQALLHIRIQFLKTLVGVYQRKIPTAPVCFVGIITVVEFFIEAFYKGSHRHIILFAFSVFPDSATFPFFRASASARLRAFSISCSIKRSI